MLVAGEAGQRSREKCSTYLPFVKCENVLCNVAVCALNLDFEIRPPQRFLNPGIDKLTLNNLRESYLSTGPLWVTFSNSGFEMHITILKILMRSTFDLVKMGTIDRNEVWIHTLTFEN